jgi:hypothetical protein
MDASEVAQGAGASVRYAFFLALQIARQCLMRWLDRGAYLADIRQLASVGLLEAIDVFDPGRGAPFIAFARQNAFAASCSKAWRR